MPEGLDIFTDRKIYSVPDGLNELMHDICKEVLRCQPKNVYQCISDYLIALLKVREAVKVAVPLVERDFEKVESELEFLKKYNLSPEDASRFATKIQAAYRGYRTRKTLLNIADNLAQAQVSVVWDDKGEERIDYSDPIFELLRTRGMTREQTHAAATKIQAYFRGYRQRRLEKTKGLECILQSVPSHESWRHDWLSEPLIKKQSNQEVSPLKKSFIDFQKNYMRTNEGDRLHMETIFAGDYEKYNLICEDEPCHQVTVPTKKELIDLVRADEIESSASEELDIPGAEIMRQLMKEKIQQGQLLPPEKEQTIFNEWQSSEQMKISIDHPSFVEDISREDHQPLEHGEELPRLEKRFRLSKNGEIAVSIDEATESAKSGAPELSIRSLSKITDLADTTRSSKKSLESARSHRSTTSKKSVEGERLSTKSDRAQKSSMSVKLSKESVKGSIKSGHSKISANLEVRSQKSDELRAKVSAERVSQGIKAGDSKMSANAELRSQKSGELTPNIAGERISKHSVELKSKKSDEMSPKQSVEITSRQSSEMQRKGSKTSKTSIRKSSEKELTQNVEDNVKASKTSGLNIEGSASKGSMKTSKISLAKQSIQSGHSKSSVVETKKEINEEPKPEEAQPETEEANVEEPET